MCSVSLRQVVYDFFKAMVIDGTLPRLEDRCASCGCLGSALVLLFTVLVLVMFLLLVEVVLFPFACLAIIPIGISSFSLSGSYLRAGEHTHELGTTTFGVGRMIETQRSLLEPAH